MYNKVANLENVISDLYKLKTTRAFVSNIDFSGDTITIPAHSAILSERISMNAPSGGFTTTYQGTVINFVFLEIGTPKLVSYPYNALPADRSNLIFICAYKPDNEIRALNALSYSINGITQDEYVFKKNVFCPKRAFVTANGITFDTKNKTITFKYGSSFAIGSEGFAATNVLSEALELDTSAYAYSFLLLYDPSQKTFIATSFNYLLETSKEYWLVAVVNNSNGTVSYINTPSFILNGETYYTAISKSIVQDMVSDQINSLNGNWFTKEGVYIQPVAV